MTTSLTQNPRVQKCFKKITIRATFCVLFQYGRGPAGKFWPSTTTFSLFNNSNKKTLANRRHYIHSMLAFLVSFQKVEMEVSELNNSQVLDVRLIFKLKIRFGYKSFTFCLYLQFIPKILGCILIFSLRNASCLKQVTVFCSFLKDNLEEVTLCLFDPPCLIE